MLCNEFSSLKCKSEFSLFAYMLLICKLKAIIIISVSEEDKEKMLSLFGDIPEPNISVLVRLVQHLQ